MKTSVSRRIDKRKKEILKRLAKARRDRFERGLQDRRVIGDIKIKYELADRTQAIIETLLHAINEARLNVWKEQTTRSLMRHALMPTEFL